MAKRFEWNFRGESSDGTNYGCGMAIAGDMEIIGSLLADYCIAEAGKGHPEPMKILIAAFEKMQKLSGSNNRIIIPKIKGRQN